MRASGETAIAGRQPVVQFFDSSRVRGQSLTLAINFGMWTNEMSCWDPSQRQLNGRGSGGSLSILGELIARDDIKPVLFSMLKGGCWVVESRH